MKRIVEMGSSLEEKFSKLVKEGKIIDFESFVIAALENQVIFENSKRKSSLKIL